MRLRTRTIGGLVVGRFARAGRKAIDDLAGTHEAELAAREALEASRRIAEQSDLPPEIVVAAESLEHVFAELAPLRGELGELDEPTVSEERVADECGKENGGEPEDRTALLLWGHDDAECRTTARGTRAMTSRHLRRVRP